MENESVTGVEERRPYFACPACAIVGEPDSVDCYVTPDHQHVDWTRPVAVTCGSCRASTRITSADVLDSDASFTCVRCGDRTACPSAADRVVCRGCGLNATGPAATGDRAVYLRTVEHAANQWATARLRVAKADARARGGLPGWAS
ncbi:hypothetical protein [Streptomyces sasae]|uniref:hypothetical protein n=1 Tax=Streptomyces sasae TaxID=1266772 RepID=UPI0029318B30|nr:hypothetical protein [Streptomyces sasae]